MQLLTLIPNGVTFPVTPMAADPTYDPTQFQAVLRDWMERNGYSQMAAAQTAGITQGVINRWLKPRGDPYLVKPTVESLEKLAPYLSGVTLFELKAMTGNLSPIERERAGLQGDHVKPKNHRLAALLEDIEARWDELEESPDELQKNEDVTRVLWGLHHGRTRRSRKNEPKEADDSSRLHRLMLQTA